MNNDSELVSIVIPIRNEKKHIGILLENIINQTYPKNKMEVFVVDGMSDDGTKNIIENYSSKYNFIKLIMNPFLYVSNAMNLGIKHTNGNIIIRMDAHSIYPENYVEKITYWLKKLRADNVGGVVKTIPNNNSLKAKAISLTMSHPFGVGNSYFRIGKVSKPIEVDTVPFGCFPKEIFNKIGYYDEDLIRNQDDELNARLKQNGGKIYLIPEIEIKYYGRKNFKSLMRMFYQYGLFKPLVNLKIRKPASLRQFVPLIFVLSLIIPLIGSIFYIKLIILSLFAFFIYSIMNFILSVKIALKNKNVKLIPYIFFSFFIIHISYGLGYIKGIINFVFLKKHLTKKLSLKLSR